MNNEGKVLLGIGLVTLALFIGGLFMLTKKSAPVSEVVDPAVLVREDSEATGSAEPAVTLVEFGDYQCPYCADASPVIKGLLAEHGDRLRFVFRDFPLLMHKNAQAAAEAAKAAGAQGKYWEMHSILYDRQLDWDDMSDPTPEFEKYAQELALNVDQFMTELNNNTYRSAVQAGMVDGNTLGVNSTPTFFVDNQRFNGSMAQLEALIESKLQ